MYRLFYNYPISKDVLFVLIDPSAPVTKTMRVGEVVALYDEERLVGYNIFDVSKTVKLNAHGIIFYPDPRLIDAINAILSRNGFDPLPYLDRSGFEVLEILSTEEHPLDEKASIVALRGKGEETFWTVSKAKNLLPSLRVVAAMDGAILRDGTLFHKRIEKNLPIDVFLMSPKMLGLGEEEDVAFVVEEQNVALGHDFFE